jgi:hypothetical protein
MKKFVSVFAVLVILVAATTVAMAQSGLPGSGWWSGEQVQNVGDGPADLIITAYGDMGTFTASQTVDPGAAYNFTPADFTDMDPGFEGSAVVSSNMPIKAIVAVTNRLSGSLGVAGGKATAQYQGIDGSMAADTLYIPIAKGDSFSKTTTYYVQNAGTADTTATATFVMKNGDTYNYTTPTIGANMMVLFSIFDTSYDPAGLPNDGKVGAVTIVSDNGQPLAGVVMEHFTVDNPATIAQSTRGFTDADFSTKAFAPIIKHNRFGRSTGIQVQNVGASPIDIQVTFKGFAGGCAGDTVVETQTGIASGASAIFNQRPGQTDLADNCTASATIETTTAGGQIVALVAESYITPPASGQTSQTSFAIPSVLATTKISVPLFKDDRFDKRTGLQIQNVGDVQATDIVATFSCSGGSTFTAISTPQTAEAGASVQFYTPSNQTGTEPTFEPANPFSANNVNCSVIVTADQPVVAVASEAPIPGGTLEQDFNNYEGFNLAP